jgi:hypothetical protein
MNRVAYRVLIAASLSALLSDSVSATTLTRGPYLQSGTPEGVTIRWRTDMATDSQVRWGNSRNELDEKESRSEKTTEHEIILDGLKGDTEYYYSVGSSSETLAGGEDYKFRTAPPAGEPKPTRIWVLGDSGERSVDAIHVRDSYAKFSGTVKTDVLLMLGDNAYESGTDREYQIAVFDRYKDFLRSVVLWPTRGNHDHLFTRAKDYYDIFTLPTDGGAGGIASKSEAYYSFDYSNIHFISLDSETTDRSPSGPMMQWLRLELAATRQNWIIAFWHEPPYTKGTHDSDVPKDSGGRLREMRENALPILEEGGVDLVLSGHSHTYERSMLIDGHYGPSATLQPSMMVNRGDGNPSRDGAYEKSTALSAPHEGTVYAVVGVSSKATGGRLNHPVMATSLSVIGSLVIDVNNLQLDGFFLDSHGQVRDHFQIQKSVPIAKTD